MAPAARRDMLLAIAEAAQAAQIDGEMVEALMAGASPDVLSPDSTTRETLRKLVVANAALAEDHELAGLMRALDARFVRPAAGGDLILVDVAVVDGTGHSVPGLTPDQFDVTISGEPSFVHTCE